MEEAKELSGIDAETRYDVWRKSMDLVEEVYRFTALMPAEQHVGIVAQMRQAAVNVATHVSAGKELRGVAEAARQWGFARGHLQDIETQMMIAGMLGCPMLGRVDRVQQCVDEVGRLLEGFLSALRTPSSSAAVQTVG